jgi:PAS domain S-box-containing protein
MATSPGYVRLASNATRSLADTAFDSVREAVLVVDTRPKHLPLVLANAAARRCLGGETAPATLVDASLFGLLAPASASGIEAIVASLNDGDPSINRTLTWRFGQGEGAVMTELKMLASAQGHRLVMLTFGPSTVEQNLVHAIEQLPFDLLILDRKLNVTYANAGAVRSSGTAGGLLGLNALSLVPTNALPLEIYARALEGCHYHDDAVQLATPLAPLRHFEMDAQPLRDSSGIVGLVVLSSEVSARCSLKSLQGASEHRLRALTENARDIITVATPDGRLKYVSGGVRNALGYTSEEGHLASIFEHAHPEDAGLLLANFQQLTAGEIDRFTLQYRVRHKDGTYRWLETIYVSALDNPLINGVVINSRDITERKQAESRIEQREEILRLAADAFNGVVFEWDLMRGVVHRSRGVLGILGIEPEELAPASDAWCERIHPSDFATFKKEVGLALINGRGWTTTYRIRDARGRYRSMLERGLIQRNSNGDPLRAIGCCVDVSEIKRLTDLLAETQRAAKIGGWEYGYSTCELTWTDEMFRIYETSPAEFDVSWDSMLARCTPESRQRFHEAQLRAESTAEHVDLELEITTLKNQRIWIRMIGHLEKLDGKPFRAFGSVQNVQAQKLGQIALENSTDWLKLSMNMAHMHAWRWDKANDQFEFAIADGQEARLPTAFRGMKELMARLHPQDRMAATRSIEHAFSHHSEVHQEFRLEANDGRYRSYAAILRPLFDAAGAPCGLEGVTQDVTAWREAEAQLRRSEQLLRTTTANTADTLMLVDTDLRVRFINKSLCGMTIEKIVGCEIFTVLPEPARGVVVAKLRQVLNTGKTATYEFELREDGVGMQYFENRAVLVRDDSIGTGISISMRNITARKRLEQEILEVSSRERQAIGRDLHDGLGQELTGIALMLRGLATRIRRQSPEAVDDINEIVGLVNQSIESARSLARGLLPVRTDSGGLPFALRALAARSRELSGLEVNFRAEAWSDPTLGEASASHLYRIAQEALTNAARHGHASKVDIFLSVTKSGFLLRITDDGAGIGRASQPVTGMGLRIMRYRASIIGAKFEIGPNAPRGTVVCVTGELPAAAGALHSAHAIKGGNEYGR